MNSPRASVAARLRRFVGASLLAAALAAVLPSCEHKDLCLDHSSHALRYSTDLRLDYNFAWEIPHEGQTDWQSTWDAAKMGTPYDALRPHLPEGVRVSSYDSKGIHQTSNIKPSGEEVFLSPGENSLLVYNNDTEYIIFKGMDSYATASITTRSRSRGSYSGNPLYLPARGESEETFNMPDILYCKYIDSYMQERSTVANPLHVTMQPVVFTYLVRYEFSHGLNYVALARGALSGMAESVSLHDGHTSKAPATLLYDCTIEPWGVQAVVTSFGIPDFPNPSYTRGDESFAINLEVKLYNGKILNFYHDVSEQLRRQPHGGVIVVPGIEISDKEGNSGSGAFDVEVEGWGEYEDVEIIF